MVRAPDWPGCPAQRLHVPGVGGLEVVGVGVRAEVVLLAGRSPHLHRVAAPGLRQAPEQGGHVADVVGVEVGEEDLGGGGDREAEAVEVGEGARPEVEEEEVLLGVADLDQQRGRRLALLHERVAAAQHGDPDLSGPNRFGTGHEQVGVVPGRLPDHRGGGERERTPLVGQLRELGDLARHHSLRFVDAPAPAGPLGRTYDGTGRRGIGHKGWRWCTVDRRRHRRIG